MTRIRNSGLAEKLATTAPKEELVAARSIPKPDTKNLSGHDAYALDKWLRLLSILNTSTVNDQFYRSTSALLNELKTLIDSCATEDAYKVAQAIVYSRCEGEGLRTVNHVAAAYFAKYASGKEWATRFYSSRDKKSHTGGTIFRPDDMAEIIAAFHALNAPKKATNAMKKGFASSIERMNAYSLAKYKNRLIDVINLVHPDPKLAVAKQEINGEMVAVFDAIMKGITITADTWESANSEAGQLVAKAVADGKLTQEDASKVLAEAKADNWEGLLLEGKLGILAAVRNVRSILKVAQSRTNVMDALCKLVSDPIAIRNGKILPHQIDMALMILESEFPSISEVRKITDALVAGYVSAIPNLKEALPGRSLVLLDLSGSMSDRIRSNDGVNSRTTCSYKARVIAATLGLGLDADIIQFGSSSNLYNGKRPTNPFDFAKSLEKDMGGTNLACAWEKAAEISKQNGIRYDRVFILSDNECNMGKTYDRYIDYVEKCGAPYVYSVDLAAYGTTTVAGPKVKYFYGYSFGLFDDIIKSEYDPSAHIDQVFSIKI